VPRRQIDAEATQAERLRAFAQTRFGSEQMQGLMAWCVLEGWGHGGWVEDEDHGVLEFW